LPSLKSQRDFLKLKKEGHFFHATHWLAVNHNTNNENTIRWAWTVSKKAGNAVTRNRLKRWGRDCICEFENHEIDINFIFKNKKKDFYKNLTREEFDKAFKKCFTKIDKIVDAN
jgi:ribonuclease P protein component